MPAAPLIYMLVIRGVVNSLKDLPTVMTWGVDQILDVVGDQPGDPAENQRAAAAGPQPAAAAGSSTDFVSTSGGNMIQQQGEVRDRVAQI